MLKLLSRRSLTKTEGLRMKCAKCQSENREGMLFYLGEGRKKE